MDKKQADGTPGSGLPGQGNLRADEAFLATSAASKTHNNTLNKTINVTRPLLPPLDEFIPYLQSIWATGQLSNNGPMHRQLEQQLADYLGVPHVVLLNNGTTALMAALRALGLQGEVITTPFSFVATSHAITLNGLTPVFADICPHTLNLDPQKTAAAITDKTTAILPVHCYGNPCHTEAIQAIASRHGLSLVYDAAHAFGVKDAGGSILRHGDLSVLSFHATKVFNTFEGGAIVCHTPEMKQRLNLQKNFGIENETTVSQTGLNGKMNEVSAAFGLLQLKYLAEALQQRQAIDARYRQGLAGLPGIFPLRPDPHISRNFAYFPVLVGPDYPLSRDALYHKLKNHGIHCRRYFYPLISTMAPYAGLPSARPDNLPVATRIAQQVLCLPIYPGLEPQQQAQIIALLAS